MFHPSLREPRCKLRNAPPSPHTAGHDDIAFALADLGLNPHVRTESGDDNIVLLAIDAENRLLLDTGGGDDNIGGLALLFDLLEEYFGEGADPGLAAIGANVGPWATPAGARLASPGGLASAGATTLGS